MLPVDKISKIGIGTWGIGGFAERNADNDDGKQIKALTHSLNKGMNLVELCPWYSEWSAVELFIRALKNSTKKREDIFAVASIYPHRNKALIDAQKEFEALLDKLGSDYVDTVQFTLSGIVKYGLRESLKFFESYLDQRLIRFVSITNSDLETLKVFKENFGNKFFSHEVLFNFEIRENDDFGTMPYAQKNGIKNIVYRPLGRNETTQRGWPLLIELSKKYNKTQNQIILNWLVARRLIPTVKSETIGHIDENLASFDFEINQTGIERLNNFRPPGWQSPKIDWDKSGDGVSISQLGNIFDEEYDKVNG